MFFNDVIDMKANQPGEIPSNKKFKFVHYNIAIYIRYDSNVLRKEIARDKVIALFILTASDDVPQQSPL